MTTSQNINEVKMLLIGVGNAGGRAAFYATQLGGLPGLRISAMDSDAVALQQLFGLNTVVLPEVPVATAQDSIEGAEITPPDFSVLHSALDAQFATIHLLLAVTGLGGQAGCFYTLEILRYARSKKIACAAIVAMPHCFDSPAQHARAATGLSQLREITPAVQLLPCQEFEGLFWDQSKDGAYSQAVRWMTESALGFLKPFTKPKQMKRHAPKSKTGTKDAPNQLMLMFCDQPSGIFTGTFPSNYNGQNLDIPTCQRLNIEIDKGE